MTTFESFVRIVPYQQKATDGTVVNGFCVAAECNGRRVRQFCAKVTPLLPVGKWVSAVSQKGTQYLRSARPLVITADITALGRMTIHGAAESKQETVVAEQAELDAFKQAIANAEPDNKAQTQQAAAAQPMTAIVL